MTEQLFLFTCADVRKYAFDHRRGELQQVELRKFEKHLSGCAPCQAYYARLEGLLDAAMLHEVPTESARDAIYANIVQRVQPEAPTADAKDALFEKIAEKIAHPPVAAEALAMVEHDDDTPANDNDTRRTGRLLAVLALAAGVALGFAIRANVAQDAAPPVERLAEHAPPVAGGSATPPPTVAPLLAELWPQPAPAGIDNVHVFGTNDASWTLRAQGAGRTMALDAGTVLVEFVPQRRSSLNVVGDGFTVEVTGTIFYVSTHPTTVGVVEGSVTVHAEESVRLVAGEAWTPTAGKHLAPSAIRADAERLINIDEHVEALAQAASDRVVEEPPRPALSKEVAHTPREQLRAAAEEALRAGRYAVAAQFYERMVAELPATQPENASLRLDLARIYIRHLGQEERAIGHLRRFVGDRPEDPLTPTARDELCRITRLVGAHEPGCR